MMQHAPSREEMPARRWWAVPVAAAANLVLAACSALMTHRVVSHKEVQLEQVPARWRRDGGERNMRASSQHTVPSHSVQSLREVEHPQTHRCPP